MIVRDYITPKVKADLAKIDKACIKMHIPPPPVLFIECIVEPINGGEPVLIYREKANSFNRNYYVTHCAISMGGLAANILGAGTFGAGYLTNKGTGNTLGTGSAYWYDPTNFRGSVGSTTQGIVVGTGTNAESFEGVALQTKIANGNSAGQLAYAAQSSTTVAYTSGTQTYTATLVRVFNNNTAGTIAVAEIGIYAYTSGAGDSLLMIDRTVPASAVSVPAAYKLTVTYTMSLVFPA
jgi:hypothetical protein